MMQDLAGKHKLIKFYFPEQEIYLKSILCSNNSVDNSDNSYFGSHLEFKEYQKLLYSFEEGLSEAQVLEVRKLFYSVNCELSLKCCKLHILFINRQKNKMFYFKIPPIVIYVHCQAKHSYYIFDYCGDENCYFKNCENNSNEFYALLREIKETSLQTQQFANIYKKNNWCKEINKINNCDDIGVNLQDDSFKPDLCNSKDISDEINKIDKIADIKSESSTNVSENDSESDNESVSNDEYARNEENDDVKIIKLPGYIPIPIKTYSNQDEINKSPQYFQGLSSSSSSSSSSHRSSLVKNQESKILPVVTNKAILPLTVNLNFNIDMFENTKQKY